MKTVFLAFSLALTVTYLSSCGDKKSASIEIIPRAQYIDYDVSEFSRLTTPSPYEKENPFALLVNNQGGEVRSCTSTLLTSGYVLTNAHCIHRLNSNKIVSPDNLYLFFRNLGDEEESVFKIKQVIAQSYKRLDTRKAENEFPALSPAENKADFQRYSLNAFKNEHDWAVLELENPSQALSRFKGIDGFDESTFDYKNFADEVLSGKNMMTFHAIDPYAVVDGDRYLSLIHI